MKNLIRNLVDKGIGSMNPERREKTIMFFEDMHEEIKQNNPEWLVKNTLRAHEVLEGPHLNEYYATMLIESMVNADGSKGASYSLLKSEEYMNNFANSVNSKFNKYDWWFILNMMKSDYSDTLGQKDEIYISLTRDYFNGPDEEEGKAWYQFKHKLKKLIKERG